MLPGGWEWLIVLVLVLLLFGRGKVADLMGEFAKGIKSFKKGLADDDEPGKGKVTDAGKTIDHDPSEPVGTADTAQARNQQKAG